MRTNDKVIITGNYDYSRSFIGLTGIIVKIAGEGYNVFLPEINSGGDYLDQIFWFPANCVKLA